MRERAAWLLIFTGLQTVRIFGAALPTGIADGTYYVFDGQMVTAKQTISLNSVTEPACLWWEIWLFRNGAPKVDYNTRWGTISGRSPQSVLEELKNAQEAELDGNGSFGGPRVLSSVYTNFNATGPVAILARKTPHGRPSRAMQIMEQFSRANRIFALVASSQEVVSKRTEELKIKGGAGDVLGEYTRELVDAAIRVDRLEQQVKMDVLMETDQIDADTSELINELNESDAAAIRLRSTALSGLHLSASSYGEGEKQAAEDSNATFASLDAWGAWTPLEKHPEISYRLKYMTTDPDFPLTGWWIQFRNNSSEPKNFSFEVVAREAPPATGFGQSIFLAPREVETEGLKGFIPEQRPPKRVRVDVSFWSGE